MIKKEQRLLIFDLLKKKFIKQFWLKTYIINTFLKNLTINLLFKQRAAVFLSRNNFKKCVISFSKNRCIFTGRSYAIETRFRLSRFALRTSINAGFLSGYRRSAW